jgi:hypothetical protein
MILIKVRDLVSSENCQCDNDANKVLDAISDAVRSVEADKTANNADRKVIISFEGINKISLSFACIAIGQLYGRFHSYTMETHIRISDIQIYQLRTFHRAIKKSIDFYKGD